MGKSTFWSGFPEELKLLIQAEDFDYDDSYAASVINWLLMHIIDNNSHTYKASPYDIIRWIDTSIEMCLFPVESHHDTWDYKNVKIRKLLDKSEELIKGIALSDYKSGLSTNKGFKSGIVEFSQKLDVYYCFLYAFNNDFKKLQDRLGRLLADTEQNVKHLLSFENAYDLAKDSDDEEEYHYVGMDSWEPLNWLCKEYFPGGPAKRFLIKTYELYALYLFRLKDSSDACRFLREKAESRLRELIYQAIDEIDDELDYSRDNLMLVAEQEALELMLENSEKRSVIESVNTWLDRISARGKPEGGTLL